MNREKVLKKLNEALERELHEVVKYMHSSFWVQGKDRAKLVRFFREQSRESMDHATRLGERIVAMGGTPVVKILEIYEPKRLSPKAMLRDCVREEQEAMRGYLKILPLVKDDPSLHKMIKGLAQEEGGHIAGIRRMAGRA